MQPIYPLREEVLSTCCGMPVVVIFKSGFRQIGVIHDCREGKLHMSDGLYHGGNHPPVQHPHFYRQDTEPVGREEAKMDTPPPSKTVTRTNRGKKGKRNRAKSGHSSTKYASENDFPAVSSRHDTPDSALKVPLEEIAFVFMIE